MVDVFELDFVRLGSVIALVLLDDRFIMTLPVLPTLDSLHKTLPIDGAVRIELEEELDSHKEIDGYLSFVNRALQNI